MTYPKSARLFRSTIRRYAPKIALLCGSLLFCALIVEFSIRLKHRAWPFEPPYMALPMLTEKDKNLRWRFSPGRDRNRLGLRGEEIGKKKEGAYRILFLGDSLLYTGDTSQGALQTEVVQYILNQKLCPEAERIETINAGVPGYTTYQELEFLKAYGLDMEPDLVVLGFVFNDVYPRYLHRPSGGNVLAPTAEAHLHRFDTQRWPGRLFARSYLAHETVKSWQFLLRRLQGRYIYPFDWRADFALAWKPYGWREPAALIRQMRDLLRERDIPLLAVVFPVVDQVDNYYRNIDPDYVLYPQKQIGRIFNANQVPFLDLTPELHARGGKAFFKDYLHLSKTGNDAAAELIARFLLDHQYYWWKEREIPARTGE